LLIYFRASDRIAEVMEGSSEDPATRDQWKAFVTDWKTEAGVADAVRSWARVTVQGETPDDRAAIEAAISDVAENSPTEDMAWEDLAEFRLAHNAPRESVLAALRMAVLTGSHEGASIIQRATFWLEHWTALPPAERRTVARDVLTTIGPRYRPEVRYHEILAAKPAAEREAIHSALATSGLATPELMRKLEE
jgi:hypothetical protein